MRKLVAFTNVSVDGYFAGPNGEIDWFKSNDDEDRQFMIEQANPSATLLFGRTTYEMMAGTGLPRQRSGTTRSWPG